MGQTLEMKGQEEQLLAGGVAAAVAHAEDCVGSIRWGSKSWKPQRSPEVHKTPRCSFSSDPADPLRKRRVIRWGWRGRCAAMSSVMERETPY